MFKTASSSAGAARAHRRIARAAQLSSRAAAGLLVAGTAVIAGGPAAQAAWSSGASWVDVRVVDVDGDGRADIVGRDAKSGQLWVQDSGGGSFNTRLCGSWDPAISWADVQVGDLNGDGKADLAGRDHNTGAWWVSLSNGACLANPTIWDTWDPSFTWVDVRIGDLNGDGRADIVGRRQSTGEWWASISNGSNHFTTTHWDTWDPSFTWVDVRLGDLNGDGRADLAGRRLDNGQWNVALATSTNSFQTTVWGTWNTAATWVDVRIGDLNGDGKADLVGRIKENGQWWAGVSSGSALSTTMWDTWDPSSTWVDVQVGDLNGDGRADLVGRVKQTGAWYGAVSSGSSFTTSLWGTWDPAVTWADVQIGDFNGDGLADIAGRDANTARWWVGLSNGRSFTTTDWDALPAQTPEVPWLPAMLGLGAIGAAATAVVQRRRRRTTA